MFINMKLIIDETFDGKSVLAVLKTLGFSGTAIKRMKRRECGIAVDGQHVTVRYVLSSGDELYLDADDAFEDENPNITPSDIPIDIIYEDCDVICVNKPAYMPTHTSLGHHTDTLANALCAEYKRRGKPFVFRAVNRLDADTSGVVLLAKSMYSAYYLSRSMMSGQIKKRYVAILEGTLKTDENVPQTINANIRRVADSIIKREVTFDGDGDTAKTNYTCLYKNDRISVVSAEPVTGRTHQLRVHFSHIGHPIVGDDFYGGTLTMINRQALHAYSLSFLSPSGGEPITVTAPISEDMKAIIYNSFPKAEFT